MKRKSQSALEFLTTYGWAFLVILIMIGALAYFGVLNPQRFLPDRCNVGPGFACNEYQLSTTGNSVIILTNRLGAAIQSIDCTATDSAGTDRTCNVFPPGNINPDQTFNLSITQPGADFVAGSKSRLSFVIEYRPVGRTLNQTVSGEVYATVR